jgi:hypothetical protein
VTQATAILLEMAGEAEGEIVLRPDEQGLIAELRGDVVAAVGFETSGAGRGI